MICALSPAIALALLVPFAPRAPRTDNVRMTRLHAEVHIRDGVASTTLRQTLHNDGRRQAEATWLLPLPEGAAVDGFVMRVGGAEMESEVLDARAARDIYEEIVRRRRDPGLLEYLDRGCLRARVFPIPAGGDVEVEVQYRHVLPMVGGLMGWSFASNAAGLDGKPPEKVQLDLRIESSTPIRNVFTPHEGISVTRLGEGRARASFEGRGAGGAHGELSVYYGLDEQEFGLNLLSHRTAGEEEGTFLMMISPKREWDEERVLQKDICFVLDTSGSMKGEKILQAKAALRTFLASLRPGDRFDVIPFSTAPKPFFGESRPATPKNLELAEARIDRIRARGGTNIEGALRSALRGRDGLGEHLTMTVFLTDGLPTVGARSVSQILDGVGRWNSGGQRIFVLGVGSDVNTFLLDRLADENHGTRGYVAEGEDIEAAASELFTRIERPVLTDLTLEVEGIEVSRLVPARLPDLFEGQRLMIFGRYRGTGSHAIRLRGDAAGEPREFVYEGSFRADPSRDFDFVPALWAKARVGFLLDVLRLRGRRSGPIKEIAALGRRYDIVTPYTSHLILEDGLVSGGGGGGGGGRGPTSPGPTGPMVPGSSNPRVPGPSSPGAPAEPDGTGDRGSRAATPLPIDRLARRLQEIGVLPEDATPAELRAMAVEVARELRASDASLRSLGREQSGQRAVDDSAYLDGLVNGSICSDTDDFFVGHRLRDERESSILSHFTRRQGEKVFDLRRGVWIDRAYVPEMMSKTKTVVRVYTRAYFSLLRAHPQLAGYLTLSERMLVVIDGRAYEITDS